MSKRPHKSAAREDRRGKRPRNDEPLKAAARQAAAMAEGPMLARKPRLAPIVPLNDAQRRYDGAMRSADIVIGVGSAGTGKTWLAVQRAAEALANGIIDKIVVTRPAVEAGEKLGFLPGELDEKIEPYFRPVREAFVDAFGATLTDYYVRIGKIEARPLAYLRGATIKDAWLIADEMQNATPTQFKMLLSRIGDNAKFIINGDPRQTDLPAGTTGLADAVDRLERIEGVEIVKFSRDDIVRSGICQRIVEAYEN